MAFLAKFSQERKISITAMLLSPRRQYRPNMCLKQSWPSQAGESWPSWPSWPSWSGEVRHPAPAPWPPLDPSDSSDTHNFDSVSKRVLLNRDYHFSAAVCTTRMVGDLFFHSLLLLLPLLPRSLQPPKAFDHPLHRPKSSHQDDHPFSHQHKHKYGVSLIPALPKELVVNPKLEEFDHPEHSDSLHHRDHATHDIIRTHSSETVPGFPPEVAKGKNSTICVFC